MVNRDCLLEPAIAHDFLAVRTTEHERIFFQGGISINGPLLSKQLGKALEMAIMVCTIRPHLENSDRLNGFFIIRNHLKLKYSWHRL